MLVYMLLPKMSQSTVFQSYWEGYPIYEVALKLLTLTVVEIRLCTSRSEVTRGIRHMGSTSSLPRRFNVVSIRFTRSWTRKYFASCRISNNSLRLSGSATVPSLRKLRTTPKYFPLLSIRIQPGEDKGYEPPREKTNNVVSEQARHKSGCTVIEKS